MEKNVFIVTFYCVCTNRGLLHEALQRFLQILQSPVPQNKPFSLLSWRKATPICLACCYHFTVSRCGFSSPQTITVQLYCMYTSFGVDVSNWFSLNNMCSLNMFSGSSSKRSETRWSLQITVWFICSLKSVGATKSAVQYHHCWAPDFSECI